MPLQIAKFIEAAAKQSNILKIDLINVNTKTKVSINFTPDSITDVYNANYTEKAVLGRSTPLLVYTGGSSRTLTFSVVVHEDLLPEGNINKFLNKVKALSYPVYKNGGVQPPSVYCKIGKIISFWGVLNSQIVQKPPVRNEHYLMAEISFTFTRISAIPNTNSTVANSMMVETEDAYSVEKGS